MMAEKILFVDDEALALAGYERALHRDFFLSTASGGTQGLATIETNGPFAVVISDMRMPGMDGAEFLAQVRQKAPDTVRMLLTGHADLNAAISAVNEGQNLPLSDQAMRKESSCGSYRKLSRAVSYAIGRKKTPEEGPACGG